MTKLTTAPIICGGVYEMTTLGGQKVQAQITATKVASDGLVEGMLARIDYPPVRVKENSDDFRAWTLIAVPSTLDEPIAAEREETEVERLRRERDAYMAKAAALTESDTAAEVLRLRKTGKSWGEIGKALGIHHNKARALADAVS